MHTIAVLHGPLLDYLGTREPAIYGTQTLTQLNAQLAAWGAAHHMLVDPHHGADEAALVAHLRAIRDNPACVALVINPGGLGHTSVVLRDAVALLTIPVIEVHLSNIAAREPFRRHSLLAPVVDGVIMGLGAVGYLAGLFAAEQLCKSRNLL